MDVVEETLSKHGRGWRGRYAMGCEKLEDLDRFVLGVSSLVLLIHLPISPVSRRSRRIASFALGPATVITHDRDVEIWQ